MNRWEQMLAGLPPTLQRLIARTHRISVPRNAPAEVRVPRLRHALCHAATVRTMYMQLAPEIQAALQDLAAHRGGIDPDTLMTRYGALRSWSQLAADPCPQTSTEQFVLLGWLLPRPATPRHPARFLVPPELRHWLPNPLQISIHGEAVPAVPPLILPVTATVLLLASEHVLPVVGMGFFVARHPERSTSGCPGSP